MCSFPRCSEAEEDVRERAGEAARNEVPTGDEREYTRIGEDEPGDYDCDEESGRCSETHPRGPVRSFANHPEMRPLTRMSRTLDKVDKTMEQIQEQTQIAHEIQEQLSTPHAGIDIDEVRYSLRLQIVGVLTSY